MDKLYLLICESWTGTSYNKEFVEIFKDEEVAQRTAILMQGESSPWDIKYYVQPIDLYDLEP